MDHEEIFSDVWEEMRDECTPYVKNDVLSSAFFTQGIHWISQNLLELELFISPFSSMESFYFIEI